MSPGRFDTKMWSASVDPMPSRMSTPNRSVNRRWSGTGSGSPADAHSRTDENGSAGASLAFRGALEGGHPEEQRRRGLLQPTAYDGRGRPPRLEHRGGSDGEREEHRVPDAVGE